MEDDSITLEQLLTLEELAQKWKVKRSWIYARTRETGPGSLPRIKCGKYLRFREKDVVAWLGRMQASRD